MFVICMSTDTMRRRKCSHIFFALLIVTLQVLLVTRPWNSTNMKATSNKLRLNVIILTHFHPDVFYLFEPLNELRMVTYGDRDLGEWPSLDKKTNEACRTDFSNLLQDIFTCNFKRSTTLKLIFPNWLTLSVANVRIRTLSPSPH